MFETIAIASIVAVAIISIGVMWHCIGEHISSKYNL